MATTPPMRTIEMFEPPPAPRFGPKYDTEPRYHTRSGQRNGFYDSRLTPEPQSHDKSEQVKPTPISNRKTEHSHQPNTLSLPTPTTNLSTNKQGAFAQAHYQSPSSPASFNQSHESSFSVSDPFLSSSSSFTQPPFLNNTTVMGAGMLPTPVKTPRKKSVKDLNSKARALFQDRVDSLTETLMPTPQKSRQSRRNNGFTLQGLSPEAANGQAGVEIYTDSRDRVPELDMSHENPFVDHAAPTVNSPSSHFASNPQKRKLRSSRKVDQQVQDALTNEEGMVYVFRGKKMYRKFKDNPGEEDQYMSDDMGTLSRKSIKPKRLFQTAEQVRVREAEKAEETVTDIEEEHEASSSLSIANVQEARLPSTGTPATNLSTLDIDEADATSTPPGQVGIAGIDVGAADSAMKNHSFGLWKRAKPHTGSPTRSSNRGRKRTSATQDVDTEDGLVKKPRQY